VVDAARPISERREQELTLTLPGAPLYVDADPTRLGQIIGNLLNNACKFTERGGHVWLTVEREETSGAVISVRDTGIGIAAEQLEHVFEMFTQVDMSLERSLTGLGIGLTLVKTLTELHGGTVEVHSAGLGQGSEFVVRLPLAVDAGTAASRPPTPPVPTTSLRILIVDDNHDSADMLATLLQFEGTRRSPRMTARRLWRGRPRSIPTSSCSTSVCRYSTGTRPRVGFVRGETSGVVPC
jgi:hypothetical protein